jgi:hypothetical protein
MLNRKECFNYREYGGTPICLGLKEGEAACRDCPFFKHKSDRRNNDAMASFIRGLANRNPGLSRQLRTQYQDLNI